MKCEEFFIIIATFKKCKKCHMFFNVFTLKERCEMCVDKSEQSAWWATDICLKLYAQQMQTIKQISAFKTIRVYAQMWFIIYQMANAHHINEKGFRRIYYLWFIIKRGYLLSTMREVHVLFRSFRKMRYWVRASGS